MTGLDLSHESPRDAAVTLRSLPRRFREALEPHGDEDIETLVRVVGPDGRSAIDHVADTARLLALLGAALPDVLAGRRPVLPAAITDAGARQWEHPADDLEGELTLLADEALALADRIDGAAAGQWTESSTVVGGTEMTALDLARESVRAGITGLRATERALEHARAP